MMTRVGYWLRTVLGIPVYFYCRYTRILPHGVRSDACGCYEEKTGHVNHHDGPHPICRHCTYVPTVRCGVCGVEYFDSVPPRPEVWTFSLWKGWRHTACR